MSDRVIFTVNGVEHSVGCDVASTTTLLQFLRERLELRGTKYMCLQGGCGACIVAVSRRPGAPVESVNACLVSITSCQNWEITTIENLGNKLKGYHPLQRTLADHNGSQCGHCSSGWIMALYSLLKQKKLTMLEIERSFGSNICRCTGYRAILQAFKKFASDSPKQTDIIDIEDLQVCGKSEKCEKANCEDSEWCFVSKHGNFIQSVISINLSDHRKWYRVQDIEDVFNILNIEGDDSYMLVAGNTAKGIYPVMNNPRVLIDINGVSALRDNFIDQNLIIGAGTTLTELMNIFDQRAQMRNFKYCSIFKEHLLKVAHIPVRNIGTIAGNLMIKHQHPEFPSDIFLLLQTVGAQVTIGYCFMLKKTMTMEDFLLEDMRAKIILNIILPPLSDAYKITTNKVTPRAQNAPSIVNAGFLYKLTRDNRVECCRIAYGGLSPSFTRARKTEKFLVMKKLFTNETLQSAIKVLCSEIKLSHYLGIFSLEYKKRLAVGLFYKGLLSLCPESIVDPRYRSGAVKLHDTRPVSSSSQDFDTNSAVWPLNQPIVNVDALIQCAGEAKYTDDMPSLPNEVFAAFVLSTVAVGDIELIDATKALECPGVIAFYTAKDIKGLNSYTPADANYYSTNEELFCNGKVKYFNQVIGVVAAENQHIANIAAKMVFVKYKNIKKPVVDIKIAKDIPERNTLFNVIKLKEKGTEIAKIIKGNQTLYHQYHFPLETIACVSHPSENGIHIYPTSQWLDSIQLMTSRLLKIDQNSFDAFVNRIGGSFGLKITASNQVALACNLIVNNLQRPCRFVQTLEHNMSILGKRLPCYTEFEVAVNEDGEIQYIDAKLYEDNGYIFNEQLIRLGFDVYSNCYKEKPWNYTWYNTTTDTASNTFCRAPGTLEHIAAAEFVMEQIACELSIDPLQVRLKNLDTERYKALEDMYIELREKSQYDQRQADVQRFNATNRWLKRGLRFMFMRWPSSNSLYTNVSLIAYHGDGSVDIVHSGVEMGQGINTKAIQICAYLLKIPVDKIKVKAKTTISGPNSFATVNSLASQSIGIGVQRCCEELLKRLEPIRVTMENPSWSSLINAAHTAGVDLKTHAITNMNDEQKFDVYGVALAEVEIDVITGEWECLQVDLSEDVGRSVNPLIDVGQIEGAFVMGLGYSTTEQIVLDPNTGEVLTDRTWTYYVPQATDIPQVFNVYFRKGSVNDKKLTLGSKVTGEPATCLGKVLKIAMRQAMVSARSESGIPSDKWFTIDGAYTVEKICLACESKFEDFKFN